MFYFNNFIKKVLQNSWRITALTLHPKLVFRVALKKGLMILEDRSYQTQFLPKRFPSPLALTMHIHIYLHLKESSEKCFEYSQLSKVQPLVFYAIFQKRD